MSAPSNSLLDDASLDGFLDGGFQVYQPLKGAHRSGMDAILLAATVPWGAKGKVADLGAGCGVAGMAVAYATPKVHVDLFEIDADSCTLARHTLELEQSSPFRGRVGVQEADITRPAALNGLIENTYDHVIANPPYNGPSHQASRSQDRARAHVMDEDLIDRWVRTATHIAKPKGRFSIIVRPESLTEILNAFKNRFGDIRILPVHSKADESATRILVCGTKGSKAPLKILQHFTLHQSDGRFTDEAEEIFRGRAGLSI